MVRLHLGRNRQVHPAQAPSWEPPQVRTLSELSGANEDDANGDEATGEPACWDLGDGAVLLQGDMLHVLNASARALWVEVGAGRADDQAISTVATQWQVDSEAVRDACLPVLARLRRVAARGEEQ